MKSQLGLATPGENSQLRSELNAVVTAVAAMAPRAVSIQVISHALSDRVSRRTLQRRIQALVTLGRLRVEGRHRSVRYSCTAAEHAAAAQSLGSSSPLPVSAAGAAIQTYVRQPLAKRQPVAYQRAFLDHYVPQGTFYLSTEVRAQLHQIGKLSQEEQPAGTYARRVLNRLLINPGVKPRSLGLGI
jgi:hypothetical protein